MNNRYSRAIERVEVTAEMRDRIMNNINGAASENKRNKAPVFRAYRKYISIAACFILLIAGAFVVYETLNPGIVTEPFRIVDCGSLDELSGNVGFEVRKVTALPFIAEQTAYAAFLGGDFPIAQIKYTGEGSELSLRMSAGSEDNSGDYNEYSDVKSCTAGNLAVTLKGNGGLYGLALWNSGGYSYSISVSNGVSEEEMLGIVLSVR